MAPFETGIFLLLACGFTIAASGCSTVLATPFGNITEDHDLEVGSSLKIRCHLFPNTTHQFGVSSNDLVLKVNDTFLPSIAIDKSTVEYGVPVAAENDTGTYSCFFHKDEKLHLVCLSYIAVGYKPAEAEDFSCISLDYTNLTCSWKPPYNPVDTKYDLYDYFNNLKHLKRQCPPITKNSCMFRKDKEPLYVISKSKLNFFMNITNKLGSKSAYYQIDHLSIVKPGKPRHLTFSNVSYNSVVLSATCSEGLEFEGMNLFFTVKYYPVSSATNFKIATQRTRRNIVVYINDLVPHTQYTFEVKYRLDTTSEEFFWSDITYGTEITESDVPYLAPETLNSAFDSEVRGANRTINIYWKTIPAAFTNGEDFHYVISYHEHYVPSRYRRAILGYHPSQVVTTTKTTYSFKDMDSDTAYMFTINGANVVGNSANQTTIVIDKAERILPGPTEVAVISYETNYSISWKAPDVETTHFTIYWCQTLKSRPSKCEGPTGWLHTTNTSYNLPLPDHQNVLYQFAVAANYNQQTSGMVWASCVALYNAPYKVEKVSLLPHNSSSLKVQLTLGCISQRKVIQEFALRHCAYAGPCIRQHWDRCTVNGGSGYVNWPTVTITNTSVSEYMLGSLKPFTCYFVFIQALTLTGWSEGELAVESTLPDAPSDPPNNVDVFAMGTTFTVSFEPPSIPNGVINRYVIRYNASSIESFAKNVPALSGEKKFSVEVREFIHHYANYSVEVVACVDLACSPPSGPIYVYTDISEPGDMGMPHIELLEGIINVTWDSPHFPNGPLDLYQVLVECNATDRRELFNVSGGQTFAGVVRDCTADASNTPCDFAVRAVNVRDGAPLYGPYSRPARTVLCPTSNFSYFIAGIFTGAVVGMMLLVFITYKFMSWFMNYAKDAKKTKIQLPKQLESSIENPLGGYDKFKSGLQTAHEAGINFDPTFDPLGPPIADDNEDVPTPETQPKRLSSPRSSTNDSTKHQDTYSSANTTKTSMDSGAEVESPPSPDGFFSDSSSSSTLPCMLSFPPLPGESKDSGLEETGPKTVCRSSDQMSKAVWFVSKTTDFIPIKPFTPLKPYSLFSAKDPFAVEGLGEKMSLANSEPSVADFDDDDDGSEPLVARAMMPSYSKFGLMRSASNHGINSSTNEDNGAGYSKFGIVYRPVKSIPRIPMQQSFPAFTYHNNPIESSSSRDSPTNKEPRKCSPTKKEPRRDSPTKKEPRKDSPTKKEPRKDSPTKKEPRRDSPTKKEPRNANKETKCSKKEAKSNVVGAPYSKFGISDPNGWMPYVAFREASRDPPKDKSYVTYQGAKITEDCPLVSPKPDQSSGSNITVEETNVVEAKPDVPVSPMDIEDPPKADFVVDPENDDICGQLHPEVAPQVISDSIGIPKPMNGFPETLEAFPCFEVADSQLPDLETQPQLPADVLEASQPVANLFDGDVFSMLPGILGEGEAEEFETDSKSPEQRLTNGYVPLLDMARDAATISPHAVVHPQRGTITIESV